jgi:hypothetical protein
MVILPSAALDVKQARRNFCRREITVTFMLEKDGQWKSAGYFIK